MSLRYKEMDNKTKPKAARPILLSPDIGWKAALNKKEYAMREITIEGVSNGWVVKVGCKTFVSENKNKMLSEIGRYIDKPEEVEKEYMKKAVNKSNEPQVVRGETVPETNRNGTADPPG